ncbi:MAG: ABC transporter substrate-binding protein [Acetobacteraceae bacterium]|nr:ABC transporter substrate-binding protein [Acetobacteraceae bacterium]
MKLRSLFTAAAAAAAAALVAQPAAAQKSADTLRAMWLDPIVNMDPYYNSQRTGLIMGHHAFDGLVFRDPNGFVMKPLLATSWAWLDDTTLEFKLDPLATFHNGDKVTADDVMYTVGVLTDPASGISVPSNFGPWLAGAEKVDALTVRLKLKQAFPAALQFVSFVMPIYPKAYRERVGRDGYNKAPVGAGPYRITKWEAGGTIEMERHEGYSPNSGKGKPPIKNVVIRQVTDANLLVNSLIGNQVDWVWQFPADLVEKVGALPNAYTLTQEAFRIAHLSLDAAGRTDPKGPLTNVLVRRAIWHAIDRQAFAKNLVRYGSRVPDAPCYFTQFGCDQAAAVKYDYNPAKAKALLAEAGYPNGFETELVNPGLLSAWVGAIQANLAAVGIRAKVSTMTGVAATTRIQKGEVPMYMSSWGSYSINDVSSIMPYFFWQNVDDLFRDQEVTDLLRQGGSVVDPEARKAAYSKAIHLATDRAYWLPIATYVTVYGLNKQLDFTAYSDELPRFFWAKWK